MIHQKTLDRLGSAIELIDNTNFAPMFRNRQINYPELFEYSEKLARRKKNPKAYFAKMWGKKQLSRTVKWLTKLVNQAKTSAVVELHKKREQARMKPMNRKGVERLAAMKRSFNLIS